MTKCPFCHFDNEDGALFCEQCKSDLTSVAPARPRLAAPIPMGDAGADSNGDAGTDSDGGGNILGRGCRSDSAGRRTDPDGWRANAHGARSARGRADEAAGSHAGLYASDAGCRLPNDLALPIAPIAPEPGWLPICRAPAALSASMPAAARSTPVSCHQFGCRAVRSGSRRFACQATQPRLLVMQRPEAHASSEYPAHLRRAS